MAYKAKDLQFLSSPEGNVRTTGKSLTLGVGEIAFVDTSKTTKDGVEILSDFTTLTKSSRLAIRTGEPNDYVSRSEDNKAVSTIPFRLKDVTNIYVDAPERAGIKVDDFVIGFNGKDGSELSIDVSENEVIELCLKGDLIGQLGYPDSKFVARVNLTAPTEGVKGTDWTMQEIVENAWKELVNYKLPGNIPITNYVDITLVNSENAATLPGTPVVTYELKVSDNGTQTALGAVQAAYPDLEVKRISTESGVTTYYATSDALPGDYTPIAGGYIKGCEDCPADTTELTDAELANVCKEGALTPIVWIEGESCNFDTEAYTITLKDTECGEDRLAELQLAFPELTIAISTTILPTGCQTTYETTVNTNLVCDECSPIFRNLFESEGPSMYDNVAWEKADKVYDADAKMGIRVRGKRASLSGGEFLRDEMPFIDDSVEISLVGGFPTYTNESYLSGTNDRFTVKFFSRKAAAQNLGGNLRKYEEEAQMHFRGEKRYNGNNYAKFVKGQETRLEGLKQYIVYSVTIAPHAYESNFQQPQNGAYTYHFNVDIGKQVPLENMLNLLAAATGLDPIQAVAI